MTDEKDMDLPEDEMSSPDPSDQPSEQAGAEDAPAPESSEQPAAGGDDGGAEADAGVDVGGEAPELSDDEVALAAAVAAETGDADDSPDKVVNPEDASEDDAEAAMMAMLDELPQDDGGSKPDDIDFGGTSVSSAEFQQLSEPAGAKSTRNIDMLLDVNLPISIELGRTKMAISEILSLGAGAVVELNKLAGEPVDLMVNQKIIAKGEVVVIDENFGVRITQLITPEERLRILGDM